MDINKASYETVIQFGTLKDFQKKIKKSKDTISDVISSVNEDGISLLEKSLSSRNFEISKYLLENGAEVNNVSKDGYNEFHFIAANINEIGALEIAEILFEKDTSLIQKDKKVGNSAFYALCIEAFKKRLPEVMAFMERCFSKVENIDDKNKCGLSIRNLISERGSDELKNILITK